MWRVLERMARGEAKKSEIDMLLDVSHQVEGHKAGTFSPKEKVLAVCSEPVSAIGTPCSMGRYRASCDYEPFWRRTNGAKAEQSSRQFPTDRTGNLF